MDALKKWVIIRITAYTKIDVFQKKKFKLTLLLTFFSLISMLLQYDKSSV